MISKILAAVAAIAATASVASAENSASSIFGKWRITRAVIAPWADEASAGKQPAWIGSSVTFGEKSVRGPAPLACRRARYGETETPPDGLFQGNLPDPATGALASLGLANEPTEGVSLSCSSGVFEFHWASDRSVLVALDNRIWTLDRTAGTRASKNSPEGVVQRFFEAHFAGDIGFTPATVAQKRAYLSRSLGEKIDDWFAKPRSPDEVPEINGDPFTDSQEYPARFAVGADDKAAEGVEIPVEFADAVARRTVFVGMAREKGRWLIGDIRYDDGSSFSGTLAD